MPIASRIVLSVFDQCIVSGTNFVTMVMVGRACGLDQLGIYSLAVSLVVILASLQESLLVAPYTVFSSRFRKANRLAAYHTATLVQQLGVALCAALSLAAAALALLSSSRYGNNSGPALLTLAVVAPCWLLKEFARRSCFVQLSPRQVLVIDIVAATVQLTVLAILWWQQGLTAPRALGAAGLGHACAAALWWCVLRPPFLLETRMFRRALRLNWSYGRWACVGRMTEMLQVYSMQWLLVFTKGPAATGIYAAAMSLIALANPILMGIGNLLAPETARAYGQGGIVALRDVVARATWQVSLVTLAIVIVLSAAAGPLLDLTFGASQDGQARVVVILSFSLLVGMVGFGADNGLRALAAPAENVKAGLAGCFISLIVAAVLIWPWGAIGSAIGALAGNVASAAVRITSFCRIARNRSTCSPAVT